MCGRAFENFCFTLRRLVVKSSKKPFFLYIAQGIISIVQSILLSLLFYYVYIANGL